MKGLELSRRFFFEWGLLYLQREYPEWVGRVAAGRFTGSEAIGADDELSRDHGWGPNFALYLTAADDAQIGRDLESRLNAAAPRTFASFSMARAEEKSVRVESIEGLFARLLKVTRLPECARDWIPNGGYGPAGREHTLLESNLYFLKHGAVYHDPLEELSRWRRAFAEYPADLYYARVSQECFRIWQCGEHNFERRMIARNDPLTTALCLSHFVDAVMRLCFLLNGDFSPYWKWLPHEFRKLPLAPTLDPLLTRLVSSRDLQEQASLVQRICRLMRASLVAAGLVQEENALQLGRFEVMSKIEDDAFRH